MIEPTDTNGSTSVKKFTSPVCGQRSFDSIMAPSRYAHYCENEKDERPFRSARSQTMSLCYGYLTRTLSSGTPRHPWRLKRSGHYPMGDRLAVADNFLDEPRLLPPELERGMAARHTHRQLQHSCGPPAYQPKHVETVGKRSSAISASQFRAISGLSLQFPLSSGITLSIERSAPRAPCLPGRPRSFALPSFALLVA
jgi:hypothetical protein